MWRSARGEVRKYMVRAGELLERMMKTLRMGEGNGGSRGRGKRGG